MSFSIGGYLYDHVKVFSKNIEQFKKKLKKKISIMKSTFKYIFKIQKKNSKITIFLLNMFEIILIGNKGSFQWK